MVFAIAAAMIVLHALRSLLVGSLLRKLDEVSGIGQVKMLSVVMACAP